MLQANALIGCRNRNGERIGDLAVLDSRGRPSIEVTDHRITISEQAEYVVRLVGPAVSSLTFAQPVQALAGPDSDELIGILGNPPGLGIVRLRIASSEGEIIWSTALVVRPEKFREQAEFEAMIDDLCKWRTALALDLRAHSSAPWVRSEKSTAMTAEERLIVLRAAFEQNDVEHNLKLIRQSALTRLHREPELAGLGREQADPVRLARYLNGPGLRSEIPASHPLKSRLSSVPLYVPPARKVESVDTPENQFVKHALGHFQKELSGALGQLSDFTQTELVRWGRAVERQLALVMQSNLFSQVSWPAYVALSSPALQRRAGYRSLLKAFLEVQAGFSMPWEELGSTIFGETRDVPSLYEFWCLLKLRQAVEAEFNTQLDLDHFLVTEGKLRVRRGSVSKGSSVVQIGGHEFDLAIYYNKTFTPVAGQVSGPFESHPLGIGSWSKAMKPDITIALLPAGTAESDAAKQGTLRFVHFDAKYRLRRLTNGDATAAPDDLDKMHAYTAAINFSRGACALYPGDTSEFSLQESTQQFVGAIATAPGRTAHLRPMLRDVLEKAVAA